LIFAVKTLKQKQQQKQKQKQKKRRTVRRR